MSKSAKNETQKTAETEGGSGGSALSGGIRTTRLLERAVRERWDIPEEYKNEIVERQAGIAIDPKWSPREATAAARCILEMEKQNQADQHKVLDKQLPDQHEHAVYDGDLQRRKQRLLAAIEEIGEEEDQDGEDLCGGSPLGGDTDAEGDAAG